MNTEFQDNILKTLVTEKILVQHNPALYLDVVETLSRKFGKGIPDFTQPEPVFDAIREVCGDSFNSIMNQIHLEISKYGKTIHC